MEVKPTKGVLGCLCALETQARARQPDARQPPQQQSRLEKLRATVEALLIQREQLQAEMEADASRQNPSATDPDATGEGEAMDDGSNNSQLLQLMARHTQLKDLLNAYRLIGGYDIVKTHQGKGVCVSVATAYEGALLETYHLEIDLAPTLRISRHDIPPFIPLDRLAEQGSLQTHLRAFLDTLSQHLNAFAGRKQQLKLIKELHKSVEVLESNVPCSLLVLMLAAFPGGAAVLCKLEYSDHSSLLPVRVTVESEDVELRGSEWEKTRALLRETPVHKALTTMKSDGIIL